MYKTYIYQSTYNLFFQIHVSAILDDNKKIDETFYSNPFKNWPFPLPLPLMKLCDMLAPQKQLYLSQFGHLKPIPMLHSLWVNEKKTIIKQVCQQDIYEHIYGYLNSKSPNNILQIPLTFIWFF